MDTCKWWMNQATCGQWHPPFVAPVAQHTNSDTVISNTVIMVLAITLALVSLAYFAWTIRSIRRREKKLGIR